MNMRPVAIAAVVGVATVWAGGTWVTGGRVRSALQAQAAAWQPKAGAPQPMFRIVKADYEKGFMSATRTLTLAFGCDSDAPTLTWRDRIQHGPLPGFAGLGAARIDSELVLTDTQRAELKKLTGQDQFQATLRTVVGLRGDSKTWVEVPAFSLQGPDQSRLDFKGLSGLLSLDAGGGARYELSLPAYSVSTPPSGPAPGILIRLTGAKFKGEGLAPLWWAFSGKGSGSLQGMELQLASAEGQARPAFTLQDLSYTQDGSLSNGLYSASVDMKGKGTAAGKALEAVSMRFSMKNLHADSYAGFIRSAISASCPTEGADPQQEAQRVLEPLKALLPHNPSISLDALKLTLGGQTMSLSYSLGTQGVNAEDLKAPSLMPVLLKKTHLKAGFEVPMAMLVELAALSGKPVPPEVIDKGVEQAQAQGVLVRTGDVLSANIEMGGGSLKVNGKAMPLPGMPPVAPDKP
ncbi:MAG: YdgA family protein [Aquabacterium sp.]